MRTARQGVPVGVSLAMVGLAAAVPTGLVVLGFWDLTHKDLPLLFGAIVVVGVVPLLPGLVLLPLLFVRATRRAASNGLTALGAVSPVGMVADVVVSSGDGPYLGLWVRLPLWAMMTVLFVSLLVELRWPSERDRS